MSLLKQWLRPGDLVVLANMRARVKTITGTHLALQFLQLDRLANLTRSKNASLVLLGDIPMVQKKIEDCGGPYARLLYEWVGAWCAPNSRCVAAGWEWDELDSTMREFARTRRSVFFHALYDLLCNKRDGCGPWVPGTHTLAFRDQHHILPEGSFALWRHFRTFLEADGLI